MRTAMALEIYIYKVVIPYLEAGNLLLMHNSATSMEEHLKLKAEDRIYQQLMWSN